MINTTVIIKCVSQNSGAACGSFVLMPWPPVVMDLPLAGHVSSTSTALHQRTCALCTCQHALYSGIVLDRESPHTRSVASASEKRMNDSLKELYSGCDRAVHYKHCTTLRESKVSGVLFHVFLGFLEDI